MKDNMQDKCLPRMREVYRVSKMWKERSHETGVRRQNGVEYSKRHSVRRMSKMSIAVSKMFVKQKMVVFKDTPKYRSGYPK